MKLARMATRILIIHTCSLFETKWKKANLCENPRMNELL